MAKLSNQGLKDEIHDVIHGLSELIVSDIRDEHLPESVALPKKKVFISDYYKATLEVARGKTTIDVELGKDAIVRERNRFFRWSRCQQEWGFVVRLSKYPVSAVKFFHSPDMWEEFTVKTHISDTLQIETPESGVHQLLMCVAFEKVYPNSHDWDKNRHFVGKCEFSITVPEKSDFRSIQELKQKLLMIFSESGNLKSRPSEKVFEKEFNEMIAHFQGMKNTINNSDASKEQAEDFEELIMMMENDASEKLFKRFLL